MSDDGSLKGFGDQECAVRYLMLTGGSYQTPHHLRINVVVLLGYAKLGPKQQDRTTMVKVATTTPRCQENSIEVWKEKGGSKRHEKLLTFGRNSVKHGLCGGSRTALLLVGFTAVAQMHRGLQRSNSGPSLPVGPGCCGLSTSWGLPVGSPLFYLCALACRVRLRLL